MIVVDRSEGRAVHSGRRSAQEARKVQSEGPRQCFEDAPKQSLQEKEASSNGTMDAGPALRRAWGVSRERRSAGQLKFGVSRELRGVDCWGTIVADGGFGSVRSVSVRSSVCGSVR